MMNFLKKSHRFSFVYGGRSAWELPYTVEVEESHDQLITTYLFEDGLKVTNIAKLHSKFGAYEWVNYLENAGDRDTQIISQLWDCDCTLPFDHQAPHGKSPWLPSKDTTTVYCPQGSNWNEFEFDATPQIHDKVYSGYLFTDKAPREYRCGGGRSSQDLAPFFNIHQNGKGVIAAIGWTGQWLCRLSRSEEALHVETKIEDTHFLLHPGEKIRTSSIVLLPYEGSVEDSQNLWRRLIRSDFSDGLKRILPDLPFCSGFWGGLESKDILDRIDLIESRDIPFNHYWIDAGWYGKSTMPTFNEFEGDWSQHTGDWTVSPHIHPNGLVDVGNKIKEHGKKFVLWFEPERVRRTTDFAKEHAHWLLTSEETPDNLLLNLGNGEAFSYVLSLLSERIRTQQVDCYRQDFNFNPLPYWQKADGENRKGITEIKHIMGLYRLWDSLLAEFPHLIIDNCASGGRRIDIETMRRSVPLWRSDAQCPADPVPEVTQCHHVNFSTWMPYSGTGSGRLYDTYRMRSAYGPCLTTNYAYCALERFGEHEEDVAWLRERAKEYLRVRPYFEGDVYPLTKPSVALDVWCAVQWHRPESHSGMIQVFVRENSAYPEAVFSLRGIKADGTYRFTDLDGGSFEIVGQELLAKGLKLRIEEKRVAKIYLYETV